MEATKQLLKNEIKILTEARDGVEKAYNVLKRDDRIEDEYLRKLYNMWDSKINSYERSIETLQEDYERNCVKSG